MTKVTPFTIVDEEVGLAEGNAVTAVVGDVDGDAIGVAVGVTDGRGAALVRVGVAVTVARFVWSANKTVEQVYDHVSPMLSSGSASFPVGPTMCEQPTSEMRTLVKSVWPVFFNV